MAIFATLRGTRPYLLQALRWIPARPAEERGLDLLMLLLSDSLSTTLSLDPSLFPSLPFSRSPWRAGPVRHSQTLSEPFVTALTCVF